MSEQAGTSKGRGLRDWVTITQGALLLVAIILIGTLISGAGRPRAARAQGPGGPGGGFQGGPQGPFGRGPMGQQEQKLVKQFDRNKDDRLDNDERKSARAWLAENGGSGRGFGGGRRGGGRGMAAGSPGRALKPADVKSYGNEPLYEPGCAAHDLPAVRERRLGTGARGVQQHGRRGAGRGHGRRQDLQERRRALPRHVVVLHGSRRLEAFAEPHVRLRRREAEPARLPHA